MTVKISPKILLANGESKLPMPNRYLPSAYSMEADIAYETPFEHLLADASCENDHNVKSGMLSHLTCKNAAVRFEVAQFRKWGVLESDVTSAFQEAGLRPANFIELMVFAQKFRPRTFDALIALGSSTDLFLRRQLFERSRWKKFADALSMKDTSITPSYPLVEGHCTTLLRLTSGDDQGWQPYCLFLAVHMPQKKDESLVDLEISVEDYMALPEFSSLPDGYLPRADLGFRFKSEDGHVCDLVKGDQMFERQWASLSVPERGLRHYRPVFV